ncbi:hypothetical protein [Metabacillus rhizosphaerae]
MFSFASLIVTILAFSQKK